MTWENLLTNKYFTMALLFAVLVLGIMYYQGSFVEGMTNVDLLSTAQELTEKPWIDDPVNTYPYKMVNNTFDKYSDNYVKKKLKKRGYKYNRDFLQRIDQTQARYMKANNDMIKPFYDQYDTQQETEMLSFPKPMDAHPELSQCQPCKCDMPKKRTRHHRKRRSETESDSDMDSDLLS